MNVSALRGSRAADPIPTAHLEALAAVLDQHRRARADQIEALLYGAGTAHELDVARVVLRELDAAHDRMLDGTYGCCVRCLDGIPLDRLSVSPSRRLCVPCFSESLPAS